MVESFLSALKRKTDLDHDRAVLISPQQLQRDLAFWIGGHPGLLEPLQQEAEDNTKMLKNPSGRACFYPSGVPVSSHREVP